MKNKIKVMYLIAHLENTGPVSQLCGLVKYLNRDVFDPILVTFYNERSNSRIQQFREFNIPIYQLHSSHLKIFLQVSQLKKLIEKTQPSMIHSCSILTDIVVAQINLTIPLILTIHNYIYEDIIVQYGKLAGGILCYLEKRTIRKADRVVTCSRTLKDKYIHSIKRDYIAIQNGIEVNKWKLDCTSIDELRNRLKIPKEKFVFLSTGLLLKIKDPLTIIKAFQNIQNDKAYLVLLGNGNLDRECKEAVGKNKNIQMCGNVNNVKDFLYAADVLVSASLSEGLPFAIIEAAAAGIRMTLSNISQHKEVIGKNTANVFFFPCKDVEKLTEIMQSYVTKNDRMRVTYEMDNLTAPFMSRQYQRLYMDCLNRK